VAIPSCWHSTSFLHCHHLPTVVLLKTHVNTKGEGGRLGTEVKFPNVIVISIALSSKHKHQFLLTFKWEGDLDWIERQEGEDTNQEEWRGWQNGNDGERGSEFLLLYLHLRFLLAASSIFCSPNWRWILRLRTPPDGKSVSFISKIVDVNNVILTWLDPPKTTWTPEKAD